MAWQNLMLGICNCNLYIRNDSKRTEVNVRRRWSISDRKKWFPSHRALSGRFRNCLERASPASSWLSVTKMIKCDKKPRKETKKRFYVSTCTRTSEVVYVARLKKNLKTTLENPISPWQFTTYGIKGLFMGKILVTSARAISPDLRASRYTIGQN